jgi:peptidoglycan/xylan/chitin deacetylase (PgdA/CDA1 family)
MVLPNRLARLSASRRGAVIVYHRVGGTEPGDPHRELLPTLAADEFDRQLRHLRNNYQVVPAKEILDTTRSRRRGEPFPVAITFDDDLESHVRIALPRLREHGLTATFFLTGSSLEGPHSYWWEDLQRAIAERLVTPDDLPDVAPADVEAALQRTPKAIFRVAAAVEQLDPARRNDVAVALRARVGPSSETGLREADVRAIASAGCDVGFHTLRHEPLPSLGDEELGAALREGREALAAAGANSVGLIAYPHGRADERVAAAARDAGFALGFTTSREAVRPETAPLLVPRMVPPLTAAAFAQRVARVLRS